MDFTQTDMVAHHIRLWGSGGMGLKPSDYRVIPLTAFQHVKLHSMVEAEYYRLFEIDVEKEMGILLKRYLKSHHDLSADMDFNKMEEMANAL